LTNLSMAGGAIVLRAAPAVAEEPLETTSLRFVKSNSICLAPQNIADELLRAEGFKDIRYLPLPNQSIQEALAAGVLDLGLGYASEYVEAVDRGLPVTMLAGVHVGCFELFGNESVRSITDLKGKRVGIQAFGSSPHLFLTLIAAEVGLDPKKDIDWVVWKGEPMQLFIDGKTDAFLSFPPKSQELRARHVGHVMVDSAMDRPWSQYFCCMMGGSREFVRKYPVATKRAARAILKAVDLWTSDPAHAAQRLVEGGFTTPRYDYVRQALSELPYDKWREFDPEDTVRFWALRLYGAKLIKSGPKKIIAEGTDWRFLNELKRELKA